MKNSEIPDLNYAEEQSEKALKQTGAEYGCVRRSSAPGNICTSQSLHVKDMQQSTEHGSFTCKKLQMSQTLRCLKMNGLCLNAELLAFNRVKSKYMKIYLN